MASKREMCLQLREANLAKAEFLYLTGEKEATVAQLDKTLEKTVGQGQKMDIVFTKFRCAKLAH